MTTKNKNIKSSVNDGWRGVPGVKMIWHGEWSDPELEYDGMRVNYWDVEDSLYELAKEYGINADDDDEFNKWLQSDPVTVYDEITMFNGNYDEEKIESSKKPIKSGNWETDYEHYLPKKFEENVELYWKETDPEVRKAIKKATKKQRDMGAKYDFLYEEEIESSCHGKNKKEKNMKKTVKSGRFLKSAERQMDLENEDINPGNIYEYAVKLLPSEDIDHYRSDLFIRKTPESTALIDKMKYKDSGFLTTFRDNIEHDIWYDLPFCYPGIESGCHGKNKKKKVVKSGKFLKSAESYGWVVEDWEANDAYEMACEYLGKEYVNQAIVDSMGTDELAESLVFLFRQWDFREWDERNGNDE